VLESVLILDNGMVLPLLTEILENPVQEKEEPVEKTAAVDSFRDNNKKKAEGGEQAVKQDCETKSFHRLAQRLEKLLGKGCVTVVMDGIYASGPVVSRCNNYGWDYMIVLKRECLKSVWEDFDGLRKIELRNTYQAQWGERRQVYQWSNNLEYTYGGNNKKLKLNVVTCTETWTEQHPRSGAKPKNETTTYAWLSSQRLTENNVFNLCTKIARSRWRIENNFLVEKHQGYNYSHCYSYNWTAMKGFHYLMKFGIFLNVYIVHYETMVEYVRVEGVRSIIENVWKQLELGKWPLSEKKENASDTPEKQGRMRFPKGKDVA
jgi:hypothetical protein